METINQIFENTAQKSQLSDNIEIEFALADRIGLDGVSVVGARVDESGNLITVLSNDTAIVAGYVKGEKGNTGEIGLQGVQGAQGHQGASVTQAIVDPSGNLNIELSTGDVINAGKVLGESGIAGLATTTTTPEISANAQIYVASGAGAYSQFKDQNGLPITIANNDSITLLFKPGNRNWWEHKEIIVDMAAYARSSEFTFQGENAFDGVNILTNYFVHRPNGVITGFEGINITNFVSITPGHTYKIYCSDRVTKVYDALFTYSAADQSQFVVTHGSDVFLDEIYFRASANENFIILVTKVINQNDFSNLLVVEDVSDSYIKPNEKLKINIRNNYAQVPNFESYAANNGISYGGDSELLNRKSLEVLGIINAAGVFTPDLPVNAIVVFNRTLKPISVEGYSKIRVMPKNGGKVAPYFSCYSDDNFVGFLGRTNGATWETIGNYASDGYIATLPVGTKFISAVVMYSPSGIDVYNTMDIVGFNNENLKVLTGGYSIELPSDRFKSFEPIVRFQVDVNCSIADNTSVSLELQDSESIYKDWGVLMLPESYSKSGTPTRLIIGCHGAGGAVDGVQSQTESMTLYKYLVANGFAVLDMNGLPYIYAQQKGIDLFNNVGSPLAIQSYVKGYQWVCENYNIASDSAFVSGGSMGGLSASNLVTSGSLKVLAQAIFCPVLDTYNQLWLHPWSGELPKTAMAKIFGFANTQTYEDEKVIGFNPIVKGLITSASTEYKSYPCPLKIWHCENDPIVNIETSVRQIKAIRNFGGWAELRKFTSGGHEPQDVGVPLAVTVGNARYRNESLIIRPMAEEILLWFRRFC